MRTVVLIITIVAFVSACSSSLKRAEIDPSSFRYQLTPHEALLFEGVTKPDRDVHLPDAEIARDLKHQICELREPKQIIKFKVIMPTFESGISKAERDRISSQYLDAAKTKIRTLLAPEYFSPDADKTYPDFFNPYADSLESRSLIDRHYNSIASTSNYSGGSASYPTRLFYGLESADPLGHPQAPYNPDENLRFSFGYASGFRFFRVEGRPEIFVAHHKITDWDRYFIFDSDMDDPIVHLSKQGYRREKDRKDEKKVYNIVDVTDVKFGNAHLYQISAKPILVEYKGKKTNLHVVRPVYFYEVGYLKNAFVPKLQSADRENLLGKEFVDKTMNSETLSRDRKKIWSAYLFNSASVNETFSEDDRTRSFDLGIDLSAFCKYGLATSGLSHSN